MPERDKSKYTDKQKRQAKHLEAGYKNKDLPEAAAEARAWATVNQRDGGGQKPGGTGRQAYWSTLATAAAKTPSGRWAPLLVEA